MFAASPALSPDAMSSDMPRPTPQPLRRAAVVLIAAVTVLALLAASAAPARAGCQGDALARAGGPGRDHSRPFFPPPACAMPGHDPSAP